MKKMLVLLGIFFVGYGFSEGICSEDQIEKGYTEYGDRCRSSGLSLQVKQEYNKEKDENEIIFTIGNRSLAEITYIMINNGSILDANLFKEMGDKDAVLDPNESITVVQPTGYGSYVDDFSFSVTVWKADDDMVTLTEHVTHKPKSECEEMQISTHDESGQKFIHIVCLPENEYKLSMSMSHGLGGGGLYDPRISNDGIFDFQINTGNYEFSCARLGEFVADADNLCLQTFEVPAGYESEYQLGLLQLFEESDKRRFWYLIWMGAILLGIVIVLFFSKSRKHVFFTLLAVIVIENILYRNNIRTASLYYGIGIESLVYLLATSLLLFRIQFRSWKTEIMVALLPALIYAALMLTPFPECHNGSSLFYSRTEQCSCLGIMKNMSTMLTDAGTSSDVSQCIGYAKATCYEMDMSTGTSKSCNL